MGISNPQLQVIPALLIIQACFPLGGFHATSPLSRHPTAPDFISKKSFCAHAFPSTITCRGDEEGTGGVNVQL